MPDPRFVRADLKRPEFILLGIAVATVAELILTFLFIVFGVSAYVAVEIQSPSETGFYRGVSGFASRVLAGGLPVACAPILVYAVATVLTLFRTGWIRDPGIAIGISSAIALVVSALTVTVEIMVKDEIERITIYQIYGFVLGGATIAAAAVAVLLRFVVTKLDRGAAREDLEW